MNNHKEIVAFLKWLQVSRDIHLCYRTPAEGQASWVKVLDFFMPRLLKKFEEFKT